MDGTSTGFGSRNVGLRVFNDLQINKQSWQKFKNDKRGRAVNILTKTKKLRDIDKRITKSLLWYREAMVQFEKYQQYAFLYIALEVLFSPTMDEVSNMGDYKSKLVGRIEHLVGNHEDLEVRYALARLRRSNRETRKPLSFGRIRNKLFHSGFTEITSAEASQLKVLFENSLLELLSLPRMPSKSSILD